VPLEFAIWRLDVPDRRVLSAPMTSEAQLEELIAADVSVLGLDVHLIGRQVMTNEGDTEK
jgi:hypothetical protein